MPRNTTQDQGAPPKAVGPTKARATPESNPPKKPASPDKPSDVHGDPETPV